MSQELKISPRSADYQNPYSVFINNKLICF